MLSRAGVVLPPPIDLPTDDQVTRLLALVEAVHRSWRPTALKYFSTREFRRPLC